MKTMTGSAGSLRLAASMTLILASAHGGAGDPFETVNLPASTPIDVALGDLDGDGDRDLVSVDQFGNRIEVFLNDGSGNYLATLAVPVGSQPVALALARMDADDDLDLVVVNAGSGDASVALGDGAGGFSAAATFAVGSAPLDMVVADVDADGMQDVAVTRDSVLTPFTVLAGFGDGTLDAPVNIGSGFGADGIAAGPIDAVPGADVVVTDPAADRVHALTALMDVAFSGPMTYDVGQSPVAVALADLDGNGFLDVVTANQKGHDVSVLGGAGGSFGPATSFGVGSNPSDVAVADLDGDGVLDLATANGGSADTTVLRGIGGGFELFATVPAGLIPTAITGGDVDGDFHADLVTANFFGASLSIAISNAGPFVDLGGASPGPLPAATLIGSGEPVPEQTVSFLAPDVPSPALGLLFGGLARIDASFKGGILIPEPVDASIIRPAEPLLMRWPATLPPGQEAFFQAWFKLGSGEFVGTNGLRAITQSP